MFFEGYVAGSARSYEGSLWLGMLAMLPLLEAIDALVCFSQARNAFICDFIVVLKQCRGQLFTLYRNVDTQFK